MTITPVPGFTPLPTPPSAADPANFDPRGDAFLGALPTNQTEMNALGESAFNNASAAEDAARVAELAGDRATTKAAEALSSANSALSSSNIAAFSAFESANSATAASNSANAAATSEANADASADAAATSANNAAAAATTAQIAATQQLIASSSTSVATGTGSKSFTIEANKAFVTGMRLVATSTGAPSNKMEGPIASYDRSTGALTITADTATGTATRADWVFGIAALGASQSTPYLSISTNTNAAAYGRYRITATLDLTLPATLEDGAWVDIWISTISTTSRVMRNGANIRGAAEDMTLDVAGYAFRLTYYAAANNWFINNP